MNYLKVIVPSLSLGLGLAFACVASSEIGRSDANEVNFIDFASEKSVTCYHDNTAYSKGDIICLSGRDHKCNSRGKWTALGTTSSC